MDEIGENARELIGVGTVRLGPEILFVLEVKGRVLHRTTAHLNAPG